MVPEVTWSPALNPVTKGITQVFPGQKRRSGVQTPQRLSISPTRFQKNIRVRLSQTPVGRGVPPNAAGHRDPSTCPGVQLRAASPPTLTGYMITNNPVSPNLSICPFSVRPLFTLPSNQQCSGTSSQSLFDIFLANPKCSHSRPCRKILHHRNWQTL